MKPFKEAVGYAGDLQAAYDYYKAYSPLAARRFLADYAAAIQAITDHPQLCRLRRHGWRQMAIRSHPGYSIFYKELPSWWLFGGILSTLRDPDFIQAGLLIREVSEDPLLDE